ncbi:MAG: response regulator [Chloroflexi bacterium]|nr:MAG: response regulator [Chloroflexota bacterium]
MNPSATRVLIAEDDPMVGEMIQGMLKGMNYNVIGRAFNGKQAANMAQAHQPDVVLMDIAMPKMNGIEATRYIQTCCPVPVVILTAYETPELLQQASEAGAGAYLIKPPNELELERAITIAVARFEDMMELRELNAQLQTRNAELQAALDKVKQLSGLLPICANCKKIRNDDGYWQDVAVYIRDHSEAEFSHGVCPDCMRKLYPDFMPDAG